MFHEFISRNITGTQQKTGDISISVTGNQEAISLRLYLQFSCKPASVFIFPAAAIWQKTALTITLFFYGGRQTLFLSQFWSPRKALWLAHFRSATPRPPQSNPLWPSWREARLEGYTQVWPPVLPPQDGIGQTCLGKAFCFHLWQRPKINAGWLMSPYWAPAPNTCFLNKCTHEYYQLRVKL